GIGRKKARGRRRAMLRYVLACTAVLFALPPAASAQDSGGGSATNAVARGKYLVQGIAVCWTCHTPRAQDGSPDEQRPLLGGPVPYEPARAPPGGATGGPRLAGLPAG